MDELSDRLITTINRRKGRCPFCKGQLVEGPGHGDESKNVKCRRCRREFSLHLLGAQVIFGHLIHRDDWRLYHGPHLSQRWPAGRLRRLLRALFRRR